jgi:hypothetical protein
VKTPPQAIAAPRHPLFSAGVRSMRQSAVPRARDLSIANRGRCPCWRSLRCLDERVSNRVVFARFCPFLPLALFLRWAGMQGLAFRGLQFTFRHTNRGT